MELAYHKNNNNSNNNNKMAYDQWNSIHWWSSLLYEYIKRVKIGNNANYLENLSLSLSFSLIFAICIACKQIQFIFIKCKEMCSNKIYTININIHWVNMQSRNKMYIYIYEMTTNKRVREREKISMTFMDIVEVSYFKK